MNMISRTRRMLLAASGPDRACGDAARTSHPATASGAGIRARSSSTVSVAPAAMRPRTARSCRPARGRRPPRVGHDVPAFTVGEVGTMPPDEAYQKAVASTSAGKPRSTATRTTMVRVRSVADIHAAKRDRAGRADVMASVTACASRPTSTGSRRSHRPRHPRIQPTHNRNWPGDGCMEPSDAGLSQFRARGGRERMNGLIIPRGPEPLVDASLRRRPSAARHGPSRSRIRLVPRWPSTSNRTDAELRAVKPDGWRLRHLRHAPPRGR